MASPADELRRAMRAVRRETQLDEDDLDDLSLSEQLTELYGSRAKVADAAGLPTAAQAVKAWRARHPKAPKRSANARKVGDTARRRRQTFLRNLQRYEDGTRSPGANRAKLEALRDEKLSQRIEAGDSLPGLAGVFQDDGVTVDVDQLTMSYDGRERDGLPAVTFGGRTRVAVPDSFVDAVGRGDWERASEIFWACWGDAYGAYLDPDDVDGLELEIGNRPGAYGFGRAA